MSITVECQRCGKAYRVGDDKAGQKMKCKECDSIVPIPEADFLVDDDVEELDDVVPVQRPASRASSIERAPSQPKPSGWRSSKVQYIGAAFVILIAAGVVFGILHMKGVVGGEEVADDDSSDEASKPISRYATTGTEIAIAPQSYLISETMPEDVHFELTVTKGKDELVARTGSPVQWAPYYQVFVGPEQPDSKPEIVEPTLPAPKSLSAAEFKPIIDVADRLERISRAMLEYQGKWGAFPTPYQRGQGLSWRVQLLPMLGEEKLFQKFKLNESWDSAHNRALIAEMPDIFKSEGVKEAGKTSTHIFVGQGTPFGAAPTKRGKYEFHISYRIRDKADFDPKTPYKFKLKIHKGIVEPETLFEETRTILGGQLEGKTEYVWTFSRNQPSLKGRPTQLSEIDPDTLCAAVAGPETATEWTKPGGLRVDPFQSRVYLGTVPKTGLPVVYFYGQFATIPKDIEPRTLALMSRHLDQTLVRPPYGANVTYRDKSDEYRRHEEQYKRSATLRKRFLEAMKNVEDAASARIAAGKIEQITKEVKQISMSQLPLLSGLEKRILMFQMKRKTIEFALQYSKDDVRALLRSGNEPRLKAAFEKLKSVMDEIRNKKTQPLI